MQTAEIKFFEIEKLKNISMWSTGKVLDNANIFFIYIAHANTYLVVCM